MRRFVHVQFAPLRCAGYQIIPLSMFQFHGDPQAVAPDGSDVTVRIGELGDCAESAGANSKMSSILRIAYRDTIKLPDVGAVAKVKRTQPAVRL